MRAALRGWMSLGVCSALLLGAAARADAGDEPPAAPAPLACLERAIVVAYLHHFQDRIMQYWVIPDDTLADQSVVARFRLAEDGRLRDWKLHSWTSRRVANSVELAFRHAESAGPIPEAAACLVDRAVEMRFENPH